MCFYEIQQLAKDDVFNSTAILLTPPKHLTELFKLLTLDLLYLTLKG